MSAPTDVLWLGNDSFDQDPVDLFHMSTAGDVLLPTLPNLSATWIAFDGTFLYFSANNQDRGSQITILTKRDLDGTFLANLISPDRVGTDAEDLAFDISTGLLCGWMPSIPIPLSKSR